MAALTALEVFELLWHPTLEIGRSCSILFAARPIKVNLACPVTERVDPCPEMRTILEHMQSNVVNVDSRYPTRSIDQQLDSVLRTSRQVPLGFGGSVLGTCILTEHVLIASTASDSHHVSLNPEATITVRNRYYFASSGLSEIRRLVG